MPDHQIEYRDYQVKARDLAFHEFTAESEDALPVTSGLIVMPTGTGKTVLAAMCAEEALEKHGRRTLFIAHREVLVTQAFNTMGLFGFDTALEMGESSSLARESALGRADVVVASIQSMRDDRLLRHAGDAFGQIIIDECHRSLADSYTKLLNHFYGYWLIGITATPQRGDRRNLGARFQSKIFEYPIADAIREKWIVPIKVRECRVSVDLRGIKMSGGDFAVGDLEERISPMMEELAHAILKESATRPTVVFTPDVGSANAMAQMISLIGINDGSGREARYVAGEGGDWGMSRPIRKAHLEDFNMGKYQYIVCCELLVEGWDQKRVECVAIARPTRQGYRYKQMVGRGTRPFPDGDKLDCLVVDFDWQTDEDVKDLCSSLDIFDDGSLNEDVFAVARQIARERAVDVNPLEVLEEAEEIVRTNRKFQVHMTGKQSKYETKEYDPVGVAEILGIKLNRKYDLDKKGFNPASEAQINKLSRMGIVTPESLSKWGASKLIDKLVKRQEKGMAGVADVRSLLSAGVNPDFARVMSASEAAGALRILREARPTTTQGNLFQ